MSFDRRDRFRGRGFDQTKTEVLLTDSGASLGDIFKECLENVEAAETARLQHRLSLSLLTETQADAVDAFLAEGTVTAIVAATKFVRASFQDSGTECWLVTARKLVGERKEYLHWRKMGKEKGWL